MALYSEKVMDHFRHPRNVGVIADADGVGEAGNPVCGDIMKIYLKIEENAVADVKFETFGCGSAIASSSMATDMIKGKPLDESVLAEEAIKKAVRDYYDRNGIAYDPALFPACEDCALCAHGGDEARKDG